MTRKRIAIACQGGGSQCAFIAGALKTLFARGVQERFEIVGFSGTSGGALTAAVAWYGLLKRAHGDRTPPEDRVIALLERPHGADAAGDRLRHVQHPDGAAHRARRAAQLRDQPVVAAVPGHDEGGWRR